jgi:hypothetical protein
MFRVNLTVQTVEKRDFIGDEFQHVYDMKTTVMHVGMKATEVPGWHWQIRKLRAYEAAHFLVRNCSVGNKLYGISKISIFWYIG